MAIVQLPLHLFRVDNLKEISKMKCKAYECSHNQARPWDCTFYGYTHNASGRHSSSGCTLGLVLYCFMDYSSLNSKIRPNMNDIKIKPRYFRIFTFNRTHTKIQLYINIHSTYLVQLLLINPVRTFILFLFSHIKEWNAQKDLLLIISR
jgi:hypothetical protein